MGVGQLIANHQQGCLATACCLFQQVVDGEIVSCGSQSDHTLMGAGKAHGIQLSSVHGHHNSACLLGIGSQFLQGTVSLTGGNEHLVDGAAGAQGFGQGIAAFQLILVFFHFCPGGPVIFPAGRSVKVPFFVSAAIIIIHSNSPFCGKPIKFAAGHTFENTYAHYNRFSPFCQLQIYFRPKTEVINRKFTQLPCIIRCTRRKNVI